MWYLPEMFDLDPVAATYVVALVIAGLIMMVLSALDSGFTPAKRLGTVLLGLVFLGYGLYIYIALPDSYWLAWYVFALPVLVVVNLVKSHRAKRAAAEEAQPGQPVEQSGTAAPYEA